MTTTNYESRILEQRIDQLDTQMHKLREELAELRLAPVRRSAQRTERFLYFMYGFQAGIFGLLIIRALIS